MEWLSIAYTVVRRVFSSGHHGERIARLEGRLDECEQKHVDCEQGRLVDRAMIEALEHSLMRLRTESCRATIICDETGMIVEWGTGNTSFLHWSQDEMIGTPIINLIPPRFRFRHLAMFAKAVEAGGVTVQGKVIEAPILARIATEGKRDEGTEEISVQMTLSSWRSAAGKLMFSAEIRHQ